MQVNIPYMDSMGYTFFVSFFSFAAMFDNHVAKRIKAQYYVGFAVCHVSSPEGF